VVAPVAVQETHQRLFVHKHFAYKPVVDCAPHSAKIAQPAVAQGVPEGMGETRCRFVAVVWHEGRARGRRRAVAALRPAITEERV